MNAMAESGTSLYDQAMALISGDFPAGTDEDFVLVIKLLVNNEGSLEPLMQARRIFARLAREERDPNTLAMMTRLKVHGWSDEDLWGLHDDWPTARDFKAVYHLYRFANYHSKTERLAAAQIRAGMLSLYQHPFPGRPGPYMTATTRGGAWPWPRATG